MIGAMKSPIGRDTKITWLGTGNMGGPMAGNLAKNGFSVTAWNRTLPSAGAEWAASQGCTIAKNVDEALAGSQVVFSCVTDGPALRSVLFAPGRDLAKLVGKNAIVIDCSTIGPVEARAIARDLAQIGIRFVDAPVTGGDIGARNATLTFMVGASADDFQNVRSLLDAMGKKVVYAGPIGSGQSLKLVNQLLCGVNLLAVVEAFAAAEKLGMDRALVVEACGGGAAGSWQLVNLGPKIIAQDHQPGFRAQHLLKDLEFLRDAIDLTHTNLPCLKLALAGFERVTQMGKGQLGTQTVWMAHPALK
jgi:3-hydroxyisobutyrate dehydrogenase